MIIAFLVAVVLWAGEIVPVIKIVTAFTIAHSITLSLAALNVIVISGTVVEPAIAASIVFVAMENLFARDVDIRWRIALHWPYSRLRLRGRSPGNGLPTNALPRASGLQQRREIGQVAIVSIVIPALIGLDG